jgi:hypothetical protein
VARVVLLYSPSASPAVRAALTARGWAVQLVSTLAEGKQALGAAGIDLSSRRPLLGPGQGDDRDAGRRPEAGAAVGVVLPEAPAHLAWASTRLLDPQDVDVSPLRPRLARASTTPLFASGSSPAVRATPRAARGSGEWDDESTGEWP